MARKVESKGGRTSRVTFELPPDIGARQVQLCGEFNGWSTTATPMSRAGENVWQLSLELPDEPPNRDRRRPNSGATESDPAGRFSYFVIDKRWNTGAAPLGNTYLLPGALASVVRRPGNN